MALREERLATMFCIPQFYLIYYYHYFFVQGFKMKYKEMFNVLYIVLKKL